MPTTEEVAYLSVIAKSSTKLEYRRDIGHRVRHRVRAAAQWRRARKSQVEWNSFSSGTFSRAVGGSLPSPSIPKPVPTSRDTLSRKGRGLNKFRLRQCPLLEVRTVPQRGKGKEICASAAPGHETPNERRGRGKRAPRDGSRLPATSRGRWQFRGATGTLGLSDSTSATPYTSIVYVIIYLALYTSDSGRFQ